MEAPGIIIPDDVKHAMDSLQTEEAFTNQDEANRGVIYISRVPPYMRLDKLRHLMSQYGEVGRIYLHPESEEVRRRRMKNGGNKRKKYTDGWVEFMDKRIAKAVALSLNNQPIALRSSENAYFMRLKSGEAKKRAQFAAEQMDKAKRKKSVARINEKELQRKYKEQSSQSQNKNPS